jgi:hypothetical protein
LQFPFQIRKSFYCRDTLANGLSFVNSFVNNSLVSMFAQTHRVENWEALRLTGRRSTICCRLGSLSLAGFCGCGFVVWYGDFPKAHQAGAPLQAWMVKA